MSTQFDPIEIPAGVVTPATKKQRSSNWAEVNLVRWRETQLMPMGGQSRLSAPVNVSISANAAFTTASTTIQMAAASGQVRAGMTVTDTTTGNPVGTVQSYLPAGVTLSALLAFTTTYRAIAMPPNPGYVTAGMAVSDTTISGSPSLGTVASYAPFTGTRNANARFRAGDASIPMVSTDGQVIPGMTVYDIDAAANLGTVQSWVGNTLILTAPVPINSQTNGDALRFSSGTQHVLTLNALIPVNSSGANDALHFASGSGVAVLTLTAPSLSASSGPADVLQFTGDIYKFATKCRRVHGWFDLTGVYHVAYLCEENIYVDTGGVLTDITPADGIAPPTGLVGGYGDGPYNVDNYGTPRSISSVVAAHKVPDAYSLDNMGAILYAMTSADGRLLRWDPIAGGLAAAQTPTPGRGPVPNGRCFVITPERFLIIFGSQNDGTTGGGSFRRFAWCDQENPGAWDYTSVTSQAGFLDIEPSSPIICAISTRSGVVFWSGMKTYVSKFLGLPYVYNYVELAEGTVPWSPQSMALTSSMMLWMSEQGMFSFDGTSVIPVQCLVRPWVDDNIDEIQVREFAFASHVADYNEWWWFFPQPGQPTNTRAIVYNYKEGWFSQVRMSRSAGFTSSYTAPPVMADNLYAYQHEIPLPSSYGSTTVPVQLPFAETYDLNINSGGRLTTVKQLMPDAEGDISDIRYSLFYRNSRSTGTPEQQTPLIPIRADGYVDFRATGRDIRLRFDFVNPVVQDFTLGQHLIDAVPRGDR